MSQNTWFENVVLNEIKHIRRAFFNEMWGATDQSETSITTLCQREKSHFRR